MNFKKTLMEEILNILIANQTLSMDQMRIVKEFIQEKTVKQLDQKYE